VGGKADAERQEMLEIRGTADEKKNANR